MHRFRYGLYWETKKDICCNPAKKCHAKGTRILKYQHAMEISISSGKQFAIGTKFCKKCFSDLKQRYVETDQRISDLLRYERSFWMPTNRDLNEIVEPNVGRSAKLCAKEKLTSSVAEWKSPEDYKPKLQTDPTFIPEKQTDLMKFNDKMQEISTLSSTSWESIDFQLQVNYCF